MASKPKSKQMKLDKMLGSNDYRSRSPSASESEATVSKRKVPSSKNTSESENDADKATSKSAGKIAPLFAPVFAHSLSSLTESPLVEEVRKNRAQNYESVADFKFNKKRVIVLSTAQEIPENSSGILYWMSREQRVQGKEHVFKINLN